MMATIADRATTGFNRVWIALSVLWLSFIALVIGTSGGYPGGIILWFFQQGWPWIILPPLGLWIVIRGTLWVVSGFARQR